MSQLWLRVQAPFAAFRGFQAGGFRSTAPVIPPSTAYGLVLNLAGIEMRDSLQSVTTLIRNDLPKIQIAIGLCSLPECSSLYQQLHSYPVGASGKDLKERTHGAKYWITPVRREILTGYDGIIGLQAAEESLFDRIKRGLCGNLEVNRYGVPFLGDNNFLIDRLEIMETPPEKTIWYTRMLPEDPPRRGSCRLTVGIDRADNSHTTSFLFAPLEVEQSLPPEAAWTWTPSAP